MPTHVRLAVVARALGLSTFAAATLLGHLGLLERLGKYRYVRLARLEVEHPDLWVRVVRELERRAVVAE